MRSDFAILDKSQNPKLLIEYDGEQHFKPVKGWGGEEGLKGVQLRDSIKNTYCKDHNIPLLRIPYTEKDHIEEIVISKLKELKLLS